VALLHTERSTQNLPCIVSMIAAALLNGLQLSATAKCQLMLGIRWAAMKLNSTLAC